MAFERIPLGWQYKTLKPYFNNKTDGLNRTYEGTLTDAVNISMDFFFEGYVEENGMKRVVLVILAFLYEMEHDEIDPDLAYAVEWHIEDFEDGNYESLFTEEDLKYLKEDITKIKVFLKEYYKTHERKHLDP